MNIVNIIGQVWDLLSFVTQSSPPFSPVSVNLEHSLVTLTENMIAVSCIFQAKHYKHEIAREGGASWERRSISDSSKHVRKLSKGSVVQDVMFILRKDRTFIVIF